MCHVINHPNFVIVINAAARLHKVRKGAGTTIFGGLAARQVKHKDGKIACFVAAINVGENSDLAAPIRPIAGIVTRFNGKSIGGPALHHR